MIRRDGSSSSVLGMIESSWSRGWSLCVLAARFGPDFVLKFARRLAKTPPETVGVLAHKRASMHRLPDVDIFAYISYSPMHLNFICNGLEVPGQCSPNLIHSDCSILGALRRATPMATGKGVSVNDASETVDCKHSILQRHHADSAWQAAFWMTWIV